MEPIAFQRGKTFQNLVQANFEQHTEGGGAKREARIEGGRLDILVTGGGTPDVAVLEIKATDWDRINLRNVNRNLYRHQRQLFRYVEAFVSATVSVSLGIIYPRPPASEGLRDHIERRLDDRYDVPAFWYSEIRSGTDGLEEWLGRFF